MSEMFQIIKTTLQNPNLIGQHLVITQSDPMMHDITVGKLMSTIERLNKTNKFPPNQDRLTRVYEKVDKL